MYDPTVLISNYGVQSVRLVDLVDLPQNSYVYVECDGAYDGEVNVKLVLDEAALNAYNEANGTSYRTMPSDCYALDATSKKLVDRQAEFVVTYDIEKICGLAKVYDYSDIKDYVIPFTIVSETAGLEVETLDGVNLILVNPKMTHKIVEKFSLVGPSADELTVTEDAYSWSYKLVPEDSRWASGYEFAVAVTDNDGNVLVEGTDYVLECSSANEAFEVGDTEITYTLSFPTSTFATLPVDVTLKVKAEIKGVENGFVVDGTGVSNVTLEPFTLWDKSGVVADDLKTNCPAAGGGPAINLFDGNNDTFWSTQNSGSGKSPWLVQINFKEEITIHAIGIFGRAGDRQGASRTGGFNFDEDVTSYTVPESHKTGNSQWGWDLHLDEVKAMFDQFYNYDYKMVVEGNPAPEGNSTRPGYYDVTRWILMENDQTTDVLQWWIISDSAWDRPQIFTNYNGNRFTQAAELDIRLAGAPKFTVE